MRPPGKTGKNVKSGSDQIVTRLRQIVDRLPLERRESLVQWCLTALPRQDEGSQHHETSPDFEPDTTSPIAPPQDPRDTPVEPPSVHDTTPPPPEIEPATKGLIDGRYKLMKKVGEGAYSTVYRAKDTRLNTFVAIKLLKTELSSDPSVLNELGRIFSREAQIQAPLSHPNIVRVLDANVADNGVPYIVTEFFEGELLSDLLHSKRPLPLQQVTDLLKQLCLAVQYAHDEKVVHRDLKPGNIMLVEERGQRVLKVLDFGLAMLVDRAHLTLSRGAMVGTPAYMSPEQWQGASATPLSDIYAIGVILYEMVTGRLPFESKDRRDLGRQHRETAPSDPCSHNPGLSRRAAKVVEQGLEKNPHLRPQSASELFAAFEAATTTTGRAVPSGGWRRFVTPRSLVVAAAILAAVSIGVPTAWHLLSGSHEVKPVPHDDPDPDLVLALQQIEQDPGRWDEFLDVAKEKLAAHPSSENEKLAKDLRHKAVEYAKSECATLRSKAKENVGENASELFHDAYNCAIKIRDLSDGSSDFNDANSIPEDIANDWVTYANTLLQRNPELAVKLANRINSVHPSRDAKELEKKALKLISNRQTGAALSEARKQLNIGNWDGVRQALAGILRDGLNKEDQAIVTAIELLHRLHDGPDKPAEVLNLLADPGLSALPPSSPEFEKIQSHADQACEELLSRQESSIEESLKVVTYNRKKYFAKWMQTYLRRDTSEEDFDALLPSIRSIPEAERDGWAWAVLAECLLRRSPLQINEGDEKEAAIAARNESLATADRYGRFVRGVVHHRRNELPEARNEFNSAFELIDPVREPWQTTSRRALAAATYFESGGGSERAADPNWEQAFADYDRSVKLLLPNPDSKYRIAQARAAFQLKKYDVAEGATDSLLLEGNPEKLGPGAYYDVMLQNAQSRRFNKERLSAALDRFGEIIDARNKGKLGTIGVLSFYRDVFVHATEVGEQIAKESGIDQRRAKVAAIYASKARFLYDNRYTDWRLAIGETDPVRESADAWKAAIKHYPKADRVKAEYYTQHGFRLKELPGVKIKDIQDDANEAKQADPEYPGGHALEAYLLSKVAEREYQPRSPGPAIARLEPSIEAFQTAINAALKQALKQPNDPSSTKLLIDYYVNRSNAQVWLASAVRPSKDRIQSALEGAVKDAGFALDLDKKNATAWWTLGNALEDIAWSDLGGDLQQFPKAIEAFNSQIENSKTSPSGYTNLGRCYIKWFVDSRGTEVQLSAAHDALENSLRFAPDNSEARYWMGKLFLLRGSSDEDKKLAYGEFALALAQPFGGGRPFMGLINQDIAGSPTAWKSIFNRMIPSEPGKLREQHAAAIAIRIESFLSYFPPQELKTYLTSTNGLMADVRFATAHATDDTTKAVVHRFAAVALTSASQLNPASAPINKPKVIEHYRKSLTCDADIARSWESAKDLAALIKDEAIIKHSEAKKAKPEAKRDLVIASLELLKEAEESLSFASARCPESEKPRIDDELTAVQKATSDVKRDSGALN